MSLSPDGVRVRYVPFRETRGGGPQSHRLVRLHPPERERQSHTVNMTVPYRFCRDQLYLNNRLSEQRQGYLNNRAGTLTLRDKRPALDGPECR
jgi:hypothetical protein